MITKEELEQRMLKVKLLRAFADHFEEEIKEKKSFNNSDYKIEEVIGNCEQGADIKINIFHYGVRHSYGAEINDLFKQIHRSIYRPDTKEHTYYKGEE